MITFNYDGNKYQVKNLIEELNLEEFSNLNKVISNEGTDNITKWCDVLEYLGLPTSIIDELGIDELAEYIKNAFKDKVETKINGRIEVDNYVYECKLENDKPVITVIDLKWLEKMFEKGPAHLIAVLFKRTDLSKKEHFERSHINHKAELIGKAMPAVQALHFLVYISQQVNKAFKSFADEQTTNR